jgi:kynurenine formamidase
MRTIDITTNISSELLTRAQKNLKLAFNGHVGTHFDVMDKEFPLEYMDLKAIVFDVTGYADKEEIGVDGIRLDNVSEGMFVGFHTGFIEQEGYATKRYFSQHPQLSFDLIHALLDKHICIIGVDFAGVRRGNEHTPTDQLCADRGVFIVENLCNLSALLDGKTHTTCKIGTYPVKFAGQTGLPCRVIARIEK